MKAVSNVWYIEFPEKAGEKKKKSARPGGRVYTSQPWA